MRLSSCSKQSRSVVGVAVFSSQRTALVFDARESTSGCKRQLVVLNAETRSLKRVKIVAARVLGQSVSTNTMDRICLDVGEDLANAEYRLLASESNGTPSGQTAASFALRSVFLPP